MDTRGTAMASIADQDAQSAAGEPAAVFQMCENRECTGQGDLLDSSAQDINVSFFCPAYLDQDNLERVVLRGLRTLEKHAGACEWLIVDDGSPDRTGSVADALAAQHARVEALHHDANRGHGAALKTGLAAARGRWVGFCDGDDQYDPRDIDLLLLHCELADVIIGRRIHYPNGPVRAVFSAIMNAALRWLFGAPYRDLGCAFKMFRREALPVVQARSSGIFTQCEMVLRAHRAGLRVAEAPVPAYPRTAGQSTSLRPRNILGLMGDILLLFREFYL